MACSLGNRDWRVLRKTDIFPKKGRRTGLVDLWQGLTQAFWLVVTLDAELAEIALRSLRVTLTALVLGCAIALPLAALLAVRRFR